MNEQKDCEFDVLNFHNIETIKIQTLKNWTYYTVFVWKGR